MKPSEIIREARNVLFERGWNQGDFLGADGSVCAYGALMAGEGLEVKRVLDCDEACMTDAPEFLECVLPRPLGRIAIADWNDHEDRTFDEVIEAFDKAEKLALIAEES